LKNVLIAGFKEYYEELNKKAIDELHRQEQQQKQVHDKLDKYTEKINSLTKRKVKSDAFMERIVTSFRDKKKKSIAFMRLCCYHNQKLLSRKVKRMVFEMRTKNLSRKAIKAWKFVSFHESNKNFENKVKEKTELEMKNYQANLVQQQHKIYELIKKAEEKLKLERKKKIETKLQLDQVVLRGVSALNIQALKLSQNSLNDVYKVDYLKEVENNIKNMTFPETTQKLSTYKQSKNDNKNQTKKQGEIV
jgi:hypothetical protein